VGGVHKAKKEAVGKAFFVHYVSIISAWAVDVKVRNKAGKWRTFMIPNADLRLKTDAEYGRSAYHILVEDKITMRFHRISFDHQPASQEKEICMSLSTLLDILLHLDKHLLAFTNTYEGWIYLLLFAIIFVETGLVIMPFLPGDSLLFAAGALAALDSLHLGWLLPLLIIAAILGDTTNYWVGNQLGARVSDGRIRWLNQEHLARTHAFFVKHGGKAIILARFVPIVRTFAPFVAGIGTMAYRRFLLYNVVGGVSWVMIFLLLGYFFGNLPFVQENFHLIIPAIILLSLLPILKEMVQSRMQSRPKENVSEVESI
jgi:membrane-associated protein